MGLITVWQRRFQGEAVSADHWRLNSNRVLTRAAGDGTLPIRLGDRLNVPPMTSTRDSGEIL